MKIPKWFENLLTAVALFIPTIMLITFLLNQISFARRSGLIGDMTSAGKEATEGFSVAGAVQFVTSGVSSVAGYTISKDEEASGEAEGDIPSAAQASAAGDSGDIDSPVAAVVSCSVVNTEPSRQSLEEWRKGNWGAASRLIDKAYYTSVGIDPTTDCLRAGLFDLYYIPFGEALQRLLNALLRPNWEQVVRQADAVLELNPRFEAAYVIRAVAELRVWLGAPNDHDWREKHFHPEEDDESLKAARSILDGIALHVGDRTYKDNWGGYVHGAADRFAVTWTVVPSGYADYVTWIREDASVGDLSIREHVLETLETALPGELQRRAVERLWSALGKGTSVENTSYTSAGSIFPASYPEVPAPDPEAFRPVAPVAPTPQATPAEQPAADESSQSSGSTKLCTYQGYAAEGMGLMDWVTGHGGVWPDFNAANPQALAAYKAGTAPLTNLVMPAGAMCSQ